MNWVANCACYYLALALSASAAPAEDRIIASTQASSVAHAGSSQVSLIDLPTVLRLAGAQNLDIQIARQRLAEARANHESALWQFLPWIGPGVSYRSHDNLIQDVGGQIIDVHKEAYTVGP